MKFTRVVLAAPKGIDISWRNTTDTKFTLSASEGWDLSATELGVLAVHSSREAPLFLPWPLVGPCDVLVEAKAKKAS